MLVCAFFCAVAHETAGAARIRHSLLPPFGGTNKPKAPGAPRRENATPCSIVVAHAQAQPGAAPRLRQRALIDVLPIPLPVAKIPFGNQVLTMISVWLEA